MTYQELLDYRAAKLNEIMNDTELLNFNYNTTKKRFSIFKYMRLAVIVLFVTAIVGLMPLLQDAGNSYTAYAPSNAQVEIDVDQAAGF